MKYYLYIVAILVGLTATSQNTIGALTNESNSYNGYTLFTPNFSTETYLINNCGEVIHQWTSTYTPGNSCYLLENGNLLRTGKIDNADITLGGVGGHIQLFDWDNNLLWEYTYSSSQHTQHHDIFPLPNGNILMLAVTTLTKTEAINLGRNPSLILDNKIYNEQILELEPVAINQANIVWEWNIRDHLIQDIDAGLDNYGTIVDHPELLDFNFLNGNNGNANWLHFNSIQYNSELDQIVMSSRLLSEIYIIDHSTTTTEAASHTGGLYGKGGDFLYRWGNPEAYDMGDSNDRTLFSQHYPHWIPEGLNDEGKIIIFNNGNEIRSSAVDIISPPTTSPGVYLYDNINGYGPALTEWSYKAPNPEDFFSSILSSAQRLPNGNTLVCDGDSGYFFELDPAKNIVWEYINPDTANGILSQGDTPSSNFVFRALKFSPDYPAFIGRDLTPGDPIELNPDLSNCTILGMVSNIISNVKLYPNPSSDIVNIESVNQIQKIEVYDLYGKLVATNHNSTSINIHNLTAGVYLFKIETNEGYDLKKIIKK